MPHFYQICLEVCDSGPLDLSAFTFRKVCRNCDSNDSIFLGLTSDPLGMVPSCFETIKDPVHRVGHQVHPQARF
jgi:hypothetical protein